jgi:hypothetical protein
MLGVPVPAEAAGEPMMATVVASAKIAVAAAIACALTAARLWCRDRFIL